MIALLLACTEPAPVVPADDAPLELRTWLAGEPKGGAGKLVVQLEVDDAVKGADVGLPEVYGLSFRAEDPIVEHIGDRTVTTRTWTFHGEPGRYVIPGFHAVGDGPAGPLTADSSALYVDLGQAPMTKDKLVDIVEPAPVRTLEAWKIAMVSVAGLLLAGGVWIAFRGFGRKAPPPVVAEPPDVLALRAWEAVRRDPALDDHQRALSLSRIFRDYTEVVLHFPAQKWSTSEILAHLDSLPHLEEGNLPRAKRLLRATDRVKYAGEQAKVDLFDDLDADLRGFVSSTRPYSWSPK